MARGGSATSPSSKLSGYERLVPKFAFYGAYHSNVVNQWIHIVCVPFILASAFALVHHYSPPAATILPFSLKSPVLLQLVEKLSGAPLSYATPFLVMYMAFYVWITPSLLGVSAAVLVFLLYQVGVAAESALGANFVAVAAATQVVAWAAQFYGHGAHEKRSPALLDNLVQAFLMAPLFVYIEALLKVGLLKSFHKAVTPEINSRISEFKAKQTKGL